MAEFSKPLAIAGISAAGLTLILGGCADESYVSQERHLSDKQITTIITDFTPTERVSLDYGKGAMTEVDGHTFRLGRQNCLPVTYLRAPMHVEGGTIVVEPDKGEDNRTLRLTGMEQTDDSLQPADTESEAILEEYNCDPTDNEVHYLDLDKSKADPHSPRGH